MTLEQRYEQIIDQLEDEGFDSSVVREFAERCALKAAPTFQLFGLDYGERIPSMYRLADILAAELFADLLRKDEKAWTSTGGLTVSLEKYQEKEDDELRVYLDLGQINLSRLKK